MRVRLRHSGGFLLSLLSVLTSLADCGRAISAGDVTVLVSERRDKSMEALGGGRLEVVGGCLGTNGYVIVWPHGTEVVEDDPLTIAVPRTGTYALGDNVGLAGGFVRRPLDDGPHEVGGVPVPATCSEHSVFLAGYGMGR